MKRSTVLINSILFAGLLGIYSSCNGQPGAKNIPARQAGSTTGEKGIALDSCIWYVFQDRKNNYWFGSDGRGVYRYDGKTLIHFDHNDGLRDDRVRGIQEDSAGDLYFTTMTGVSKYDGNTISPLVSTGSTTTTGLWRLQPTDLWFAAGQDSGVVYRYDGATLHRLQFPKTKEGEDFIAKFPRSQYPAMTFSPYDVYSIYRDRQGSVWFGTNLGVCRYNGSTHSWISEQELGIDDISFHVRSVLEDSSGRFWFTTTMQRFEIYGTRKKENNQGAISYTIEPGVVSSKTNDAAYFFSSTTDDSGNIWLVTYNKGVWKYDGKRLTQYWVQDKGRNVTTFTIYKDRSGDLWVGTHNAGAYKYNGKRFERFKLP